MVCSRSASALFQPAFPTASADARNNGLKHVLVLAKRSLIKTWRTPEALIDVTLQPIIFLLLFVYVFGGAISGNTADYLQFALPGVLVQTVVFSTMGTGVALNDDFAKGVFDRFRSLPIARIAPLVGAVLGDAVRYTLSIVILMGTGFALGLRFQNGIGKGLLALVIPKPKRAGAKKR